MNPLQVAMDLVAAGVDVIHGMDEQRSHTPETEYILGTATEEGVAVFSALAVMVNLAIQGLNDAQRAQYWAALDRAAANFEE